MLRRAACTLPFALLALACSRVPSPLTPSLAGSVGLPHQGCLTNAVQLPSQGPAHRWFRAAGHYYGTREMVDTIQFAAARVRDQYPGSPKLLVGDLSARRGGRLRGHASHRSGRDVDLLFYMTSVSGEPIDSAGFVKFGADGLAEVETQRGVRWAQFDVARNWALTKALVEAPGPGVVWLFVSRPLEALLTEYAFASGEDPELVWYAENVMLQPRNALPHDDHFHLRIACSQEQTVQGCEDGGPQWPWLRPAPRLEWPEEEDAVIAALQAD
jgi:penicillin-insensitive murein endopeptidase